MTERFVAEGAHVFATDLDGAEDCAADHAGENITYLQADVASEDDWQRVANAISERAGKLHVLVNNAGIDGADALEDLTLERWRKVMAVNVEGAFLATRYCRDLLARGGADCFGGASIVNVSSVMGRVGFTDTSAYNTSKGAIKLFSKATAIEFASKQVPIRVNSIHPGFVETPLLDKGLQKLVNSGIAASVDEVTAGISAMTPLGRLAKASEIAGAVLFLASEDASYMTGSELYVDGGWTAQ